MFEEAAQGSSVLSWGCASTSPWPQSLCGEQLNSRRTYWSSPPPVQTVPALTEDSSKERHGTSITFFWKEPGVGEPLGLCWQLDSPWTPVPYQCMSADWSDSQLATFKKWSLRLYFPHSQILSNRPVTSNTCSKAVKAWVWISDIPVLYATSLILRFL